MSQDFRVIELMRNISKQVMVLKVEDLESMKMMGRECLEKMGPDEFVKLKLKLDKDLDVSISRVFQN